MSQSIYSTVFTKKISLNIMPVNCRILSDVIPKFRRNFQISRLNFRNIQNFQAYIYIIGVDIWALHFFGVTCMSAVPRDPEISLFQIWGRLLEARLAKIQT